MAREQKGITRVGSLFERYHKLLKAPQSSVTRVFVEVVKDICGFTIVAENVDYNPQTRLLIVRVPSALKTELLLHKSDLLIHLQGRLGEKSAPRDIF